jgi:hypothetical protein
MPVRVDKLGAHLEAYMKTRPAINALRLCHRFGTGPHCYINKLPVELIGEIEKYVVAPARVEALETWSSEYKCFELRCDLVDDHFTRKEQHEMFHDMKLNRCPGSRFCSFWRKRDSQTIAKHHEALLHFVANSDHWEDAHDNKVERWVNKVDTQLPSCIFQKNQEFVKSHFGIDIWISKVRLPPASDSADKTGSWALLDEARYTILAYMTLPNNLWSREDWDGIEDELDDFQGGFAKPVELGAIPTEASLRRFSRALNLLDLEVFIHAIQSKQRRTVVSPPSDVQSSITTDDVDGSTAKWPRLTLLTRSESKTRDYQADKVGRSMKLAQGVAKWKHSASIEQDVPEDRGHRNANSDVGVVDMTAVPV